MTPCRSRVYPTTVVVGVLLMISVSGCARQPEESRYRFTAMGTLVEITIFDFPVKAAGEAAREVESLFLDLQHEWDPWNDGSLGQLNRAAQQGAPVTPDADLADLLDRASRISTATGGVFDPAVGRLVKLWGFNDAEALPDRPPSADTVQRTLESTVPLARLWNRDTGTLAASPGTTIDLGAFAKGEAVDRAIALLKSRGVDNAIVNAGGDLRAIGRHGDRAWKIGVREPRGPGILAAIQVSGDETVFTSGDYERFFDYQGHRYHHVLDPRTGFPSRGLISVTVMGSEAATTDAASTALMVAGPDHWPAVARALGVRRVMAVREDGVIEMSPEMRERVTILREAEPVVELLEVQ